MERLVLLNNENGRARTKLDNMLSHLEGLEEKSKTKLFFKKKYQEDIQAKKEVILKSIKELNGIFPIKVLQAYTADEIKHYLEEYLNMEFSILETSSEHILDSNKDHVQAISNCFVFGFNNGSKYALSVESVLYPSLWNENFVRLVMMEQQDSGEFAISICVPFEPSKVPFKYIDLYEIMAYTKKDPSDSPYEFDTGYYIENKEVYEELEYEYQQEEKLDVNNQERQE